jgi:hypothetical protein
MYSLSKGKYLSKSRMNHLGIQIKDVRPSVPSLSSSLFNYRGVQQQHYHHLSISFQRDKSRKEQ